MFNRDLISFNLFVKCKFFQMILILLHSWNRIRISYSSDILLENKNNQASNFLCIPTFLLLLLTLCENKEN